MKQIIYSILLLICCSAIQGQEILIQNATVHTQSDKGTIENTSIYIVDGQIEAIGPRLDVASDTKIIDAAGLQVTPGLINPYTALGIIEIGAVRSTVDVETDDEMFSTSYNIAPAFNPASSLIPLNRIHGLTMVIVAPDSGHHVFAGQAALAHLHRSGDLLIDRSIAMFARFGARAGRFAGGSRAAAYAKMRHAFLDTKEYIENSDAVMRGNWRDLSLPKHDLEALIPVVEGTKPLVIDVHRASDIRTLLELKKEFNLNIIIVGGAEAWMVADELAAENVPVILDPMYNLPGNFDRLGARMDAASLLHNAGVKLIFTTLTTSHNPFLVRQSAGNAVAHGLPSAEALMAMTINPAEIFGIDDRFGSIEEGKVADLVIWDGDPLELLTRAKTVIINGELIPMVSRSSRLRERYRNLKDTTPYIYRK